MKNKLAIGFVVLVSNAGVLFWVTAEGSYLGSLCSLVGILAGVSLMVNAYHSED